MTLHEWQALRRRSWLLLRARYRWQHCVGAGLCLASLVLLVSTDTAAPKPELARPLLGDAIVLLGAMCYACCNVAQEMLLREPASFCCLV